MNFSREPGRDNPFDRASPVTSASRTLIGISELDSRIQDELAEYGGPRDSHVVLWRDSADATGCNWNARIDRVRGAELSNSGWWNIVPELRARFNVS